MLKTTLKWENTNNWTGRFVSSPFSHPPLLAVIVELSGGRLRANYLNVSDCESIIKNEPRLRNMLLDGSNHGYKSVRLLSKDLSVSSAKYS